MLDWVGRLHASSVYAASVNPEQGADLVIACESATSKFSVDLVGPTPHHGSMSMSTQLPWVPPSPQETYGAPSPGAAALGVLGRAFGESHEGARRTTRLIVSRIATPLGSMVAAATDDALCLLEFEDRRMLATQITRLGQRIDGHFVPGANGVLDQVREQLEAYFAGCRRRFDLPLLVPGTVFQCAVWDQLATIPYATTRSYGEQAAAMGRRDAVRAVARANGDNRIAIVIPCHRVVAADGKLTGYAGRLWRKRALLELELERGSGSR